MSAAPLLDIDLTAHDLYRGGFPHALFDDLRDQHAVWRHPRTELNRSPDGIEFWAALGHPELQAVARDWKTFSLARNEIGVMFDQLLTRYPDVEIIGPTSYLVSAPERRSQWHSPTCRCGSRPDPTAASSSSPSDPKTVADLPV